MVGRRPRLLDRPVARSWHCKELALAAHREAAIADPDLPMVAWIHEQNAASQAVARHIGLSDYGLREPQRWNGEPMHYWADREPYRA
jgi:RimJ/RimL family protein N-acetyltransferase